MIKNYFKIALRHLLKNKGYALINTTGLTIALAFCILTFLFIKNEMSYENFHSNSDRIYRVVTFKQSNGKIFRSTSTPLALGPALQKDIPEIIQATRFFNPDNPKPLIRYEDKRFYESKFYFVDDNVFEIFSFSLKEGHWKTALTKPFSVVITEDIAKKYFGDENPIGKIIVFQDYLKFTVTGVLHNLPENTHLNFDFLASFSSVKEWLGEDIVSNWHNSMSQIYTLLPADYQKSLLERKLDGFIENYHDEGPQTSWKIFLQPIKRIHLYSETEYGIASEGNILNVYIFSIIALFILIIASINFMNLATALSTTRAKEIGLRKVMGAEKSDIIKQFLGESILMAMIALILAIVISILIFPEVQSMVGKEIPFHFDSFTLLFIAAITLVIGFLSGLYPAFYLSSFQPVDVMRDSLSFGVPGAFFRNILIVFQFSISVTLMISTIFIIKQLDFLRNKELGFVKESVLVVPIRDGELRQNSDQFINNLLQSPLLKSASAAALFPGGPVGQMSFRYEKEDGSMEVSTFRVLWSDYDFLDALEIKLIAGRNFAKEYSTDKEAAFILNETAVRGLGWTPNEAIGKKFARHSNGDGKNVVGRVIGVVQDFNFKSLHSNIEPLVIHIWPWPNYLLIKFNPANTSEVLRYIQEKIQSIFPDRPFEYFFLEDIFDSFYKSEENISGVSSILSIIALIIACLGLFGLISFRILQRLKEISIRKVYGASVTNIITYLLKEFLVLVLYANIIAWPVAFFAIRSWLQQFPYQTELNLGIFVVVSLTSFVIALLTISYQTTKAANSNPTNILRYK
ncbi:MAG: FtsX-like permease family protein [Calditrichaceae bacterium]